MMRFTSCLVASSVAFGCLALSGCKAGEEYVKRDPVRAPNEWNGRLDGVLTAADLDPATLRDWWLTLADAKLNVLMEAGIAANLDLRIAKTQLRRARAQRLVAQAAQGPSVSGNVGGNSSTTEAGTGELYSAGLDASWELDVFGRLSRGVEAADADLAAAEESRRDVLVSVIAEIALNYIDLRTFERRQQIAQQNLEAQDRSLKILQAQLDAGSIARLDVDRAAANLEGTRASLPALEEQVVKTRNRLAVLVGRPPGALDEMLGTGALPKLPSAKVAVGVPAEVLRRRPDVRRAERSLAAETARLGVAKADLYPTFALRGTIGLESASLSSLFRTASGMFGLGASSNWVLYDGGRIRQNIEIQSTVQEEALIGYEGAILNALEDVQGAIVGFTQEQLRYRSLTAAGDAARRAAALAQDRYEAQIGSFLNVLDAQRTRLQAEDTEVQSEGTILKNLVRLYKSLGGGWDPESPQAR